MKNRIILFLLAITIIVNANASSTIFVAPAIDHKIDLNENPKLSKEENARLSRMRLFVALNASEYEKLRGKKLNVIERVTFKINQRRMHKMVNLYKDGYGPTTLQKISWLLKGLILGPIALILGYLLLKDDDRELIKWIWFGFAGFIVIVALVLLAA